MLYQVIDQFNEKKVFPKKIYSILLNEMHPFYDGSGRTYKILFANYDKTNLLMRQKFKNW